MPRLSKSTEFPPHTETVFPAAALPGGDVELRGKHLGPRTTAAPFVLIDGSPAHVLMSRSERICFRVPEQLPERISARSTSLAASRIEVRNQSGSSLNGNADAPNQTPTLQIARQLSDGLHPVTSPVVSRSGMIFATISGPRGKQTPVSIVRISPDGIGTPFVSGILNPTGLAFNPDGELFVTSRAEGNVYRIDAGGEATIYAEGMGTATGAAFDSDGNLFVGDRNGTIFKITPPGTPGNPDSALKIFVYATLEPSPAAYHLAVGADGTLYVTAPSLSPNDCVWAIDREGTTSAWFRGLGRPQGLALDQDHNIYVAASLHGQRGLIRITPTGNAELVVAGPNLVGVAFSPLGTAVLATNEAVYDVNLGVEGLRLY